MIRAKVSKIKGQEGKTSVESFRRESKFTLNYVENYNSDDPLAVKFPVSRLRRHRVQACYEDKQGSTSIISLRTVANGESLQVTAGGNKSVPLKIRGRK